MIGRTVSHYRVLKKLGQGGMGVVYLAEDTHLGRQVAVKFSPAAGQDEQFRARFLTEARAASAIVHPSIAAIYDYGETEDGEPFIVMELVPGEELFHILRRGPIPLGESVRIAAAVAHALGEAHRHGIIHRDIKPSNVIVNQRGVKVLDFGLAKQLDREVNSADATTLQMHATRAGVMLGTPLYMSPEQARQAPVGPASDVFSLGAMLYECLTGKAPFSGASAVEILGQVLHVNPPPPSALNPGVPPELDRITLKALAKAPQERYQTALEVAADLEAVLAVLTHNESEPSPSSLSPAARPSVRRVRRRRAAAVGMLGIALAGAAWWWLAYRPYQPAPEALRWYNEGVAALRDGTYLKASAALERAVARDPGFPLAHARLAEAWLELDYADKAREELLRVAPAGAAPRVSRAEQLYIDALQATLTADFNGAAVKYQQIVSGAPEPEKANAYVDLGRAYEKSERLQDAVKSYREATRRRPQEPAAWLRLGILAGRQSDPAGAASDFDQAESLYRSLSNLEGVTEVLYQRAVLANRLGRPKDALPWLEKAGELARSSGNLQQRILILLQASNSADRLDDAAEAQRDAAEALELARAKGLENLTTRGLIDVGNTLFVRGDYEEARKLYDQALAYARRYKSGRSEARALLSLGSLNLQRGRRDEGLSQVEQAQAWYERGGYLKEASLALILIGRTRRAKGEYDAALQSFQQQVQIARKLQDAEQVSFSLQGMASVLEEQERWPEALAVYREAYDSAKQAGHLRSAAYSLLGAGGVLGQLGRYAEARQALDQLGSDLSRELSLQAALARVKLNLSQRQFPAVVTEVRRLLAGPSPDGETAAVLKMALATALASAGSSRDATAAAREALAFAVGAGSPALLSDAKLSTAEAALAAGDSREASKQALEAEQWFEKVGRVATEWRCWLVAAQAEARGGSAARSREYAAKGLETVAHLKEKWDAETARTYGLRPDVQFARAQLSRLAAAK